MQGLQDILQPLRVAGYIVHCDLNQCHIRGEIDDHGKSEALTLSLISCRFKRQEALFLVLYPP